MEVKTYEDFGTPIKSVLDSLHGNTGCHPTQHSYPFASTNGCAPLVKVKK
jgi:hypothetical protein